jgi:hypothetical protein
VHSPSVLLSPVPDYQCQLLRLRLRLGHNKGASCALPLCVKLMRPRLGNNSRMPVHKDGFCAAAGMHVLCAQLLTSAPASRQIIPG